MLNKVQEVKVMRVPGLKWFLKTSPPEKLQNDIPLLSGQCRHYPMWVAVAAVACSGHRYLSMVLVAAQCELRMRDDVWELGTATPLGQITPDLQ